MAVRALRSKLSERILTHVLEDAQIMPHRLVKGTPPLAPQGTKKIAPLVPKGFTFGLQVPKANIPLHNEAGYSLCSSFKAKSGPNLIHGRRNFSSGPPGTKTICKMDSGNKGSSGLGTEKRSAAEGDAGSSRSRFEVIADVIGFCGLVICTCSCVMTYHTVWKIYCSIKALDKAE